LVKLDIISNNIRTVHGDFTQNQAYDDANIPFESIHYFYMGINSEPLEKLAEKIHRESSNGTKLIVYGMFDERQEPNLPLQLVNKTRSKNLLADFLIYSK